jgi:biotin operon repressor
MVLTITNQAPQPAQTFYALTNLSPARCIQLYWKMEAAIPTSLPLTPGEIACFQALVKPAIVYLLMLRLDRPAGARELADILGLDEHTVAKYLRMLDKLDLVVRSRHKRGYKLVGDPRALLGADLTVNKLQFEPASSISVINHDLNTKDQLTEAVDPPNPRNNPNIQASPEAAAALQSLGIGEPKRSALARLDYVTPEYIRAWHAHLSYVKGDAYRPGLLIHVLETGDPAPEVNELGHPLMCECRECNPVDPIICPACFSHPCYCE